MSQTYIIPWDHTWTLMKNDLTTLVSYSLIMSGWNAEQDDVVVNTGPQVMFEAKDFTGIALLNPVVAGDAIRPATTLQGVQYTFLTNSDGSKSPVNEVTGSLSIVDTAPAANASSGTSTIINAITAAGNSGWIPVITNGYKTTTIVVQCSWTSGTITATLYGKCTGGVLDDTVIGEPMEFVASGSDMFWIEKPIGEYYLDITYGVGAAGTVSAEAESVGG